MPSSEKKYLEHHQVGPSSVFPHLLPLVHFLFSFSLLFSPSSIECKTICLGAKVHSFHFHSTFTSFVQFDFSLLLSSPIELCLFTRLLRLLIFETLINITKLQSLVSLFNLLTGTQPLQLLTFPLEAIFATGDIHPRHVHQSSIAGFASSRQHGFRCRHAHHICRWSQVFLLQWHPVLHQRQALTQPVYLSL